MGDVTVKDPVKKYKKKMKRMCCCGVLWMFIGLAILLSGIALLVKFSEHWGDEETWKRHLAYTGLAFVLIGVVGAIIGIILCVILYKIYQRINEGGGKMKKFKTPTFAPGEAPYPQQPPGPGDMAQQPHGQIGQPSGPQPSAPTVSGDVKIEVAEHHKF